MSDIGVAVIGFGLAGRVFHAPFVSAVPGLKLEAIVQRRGGEAAKAYPAARILRSVEEAFADPAIQLIVVGTPNETHFTLAKQALEAGKHVVIDKPFAATSAQARELIELASSRSLIIAPFHNRRWDGDFLTVRKLIDRKSVGRLVTFESHFDRFRPLPRGHVEGVEQPGQRNALRPRAASGRSDAGALRNASGDHRQRSQGP